MQEITINGKTYAAKKCTVRTLIQDQKISEKMEKAVEMGRWDEHEKLYTQRCGLYLEGDVSELKASVLSPAEGVELASFFLDCLGLRTQRSSESAETSEGSTAPEW
jgi:hypothetical protein